MDDEEFVCMKNDTDVHHLREMIYCRQSSAPRKLDFITSGKSEKGKRDREKKLYIIISWIRHVHVLAVVELLLRN